MRPGEPVKPRAVGRYVLFGEIARGGMATVHLGRLRGPAGFARTVAIKRLHQPYAGDPEFVSMFLDEARLAARIRHPNVVSMLDVVAEEAGELFLVMDYIHGDSLSHLVRVAGKQRIPMPRRVVVTIMVGVLSGLDAAHEARNERGVPLEIVHRDVSPQNVILGLEGVPMVLDFGVAKASLRVQGLSQSGMIKGKIAYMAPEQLSADGVDRRADVYSAGVMLWEGLTGRRLFDPSVIPDVAKMASTILAGELAPPSSVVASTPKPLDDIVMKALSRNRNDRFATARDMAMALEKAASLVPARQVGDWVAQVAGAALQERAVLVHEIEGVELPAAKAESLPATDDASGLPRPAPAASPALPAGIEPAVAPPATPASEDVNVDSLRGDALQNAAPPPALESPSGPPQVPQAEPPAEPPVAPPVPVVARPAPAPSTASRAPLPPPPKVLPKPPTAKLAVKPLAPGVAAPPVASRGLVPAPPVGPSTPESIAPVKAEGPVLAGQLPVQEAPGETGPGVTTFIGRPVPEWKPEPAPPPMSTTPSAEARPPAPAPAPIPVAPVAVALAVAIHEPSAEPEPEDRGLEEAFRVPASPSLPSDGEVVPVRLPPRGLLWGAAAACLGLVVITGLAVRSRLGSSVEPAPSASAAASSAPPQPDASEAPPEVASAPIGLPATPPEPPQASATPRGASPPAAPSPPRRPRPPAKGNCNPPFTLDSQGVKVPKRECFR